MRKIFLLLVLLPTLALAQTAARFDLPVLTTAPSTTTPGNQPPLYAVINATVSVCGYPATMSGGVCTNTITTYTDSTLATACPATAQLTAPGTSACISTTGLQGVLGFWYNSSAQAHMTYTVSTKWGNFGPYDILQSPSPGCTTDCVVTDPTGSQTITQPSGTTLLIDGQLTAPLLTVPPVTVGSLISASSVPIGTMKMVDDIANTSYGLCVGGGTGYGFAISDTYNWYCNGAAGGPSLPLTGGTLTGPLAGTTATFSTPGNGMSNVNPSGGASTIGINAAFGVDAAIMAGADPGAKISSAIGYCNTLGWHDCKINAASLAVSGSIHITSDWNANSPNVVGNAPAMAIDIDFGGATSLIQTDIPLYVAGNERVHCGAGMTFYPSNGIVGCTFQPTATFAANYSASPLIQLGYPNSAGPGGNTPQESAEVDHISLSCFEPGTTTIGATIGLANYNAQELSRWHDVYISNCPIAQDWQTTGNSGSTAGAPQNSGPYSNVNINQENLSAGTIGTAMCGRMGTTMSMQGIMQIENQHCVCGNLTTGQCAVGYEIDANGVHLDTIKVENAITDINLGGHIAPSAVQLDNIAGISDGTAAPLGSVVNIASGKAITVRNAWSPTGSSHVANLLTNAQNGDTCAYSGNSQNAQSTLAYYFEDSSGNVTTSCSQMRDRKNLFQSVTVSSSTTLSAANANYAYYFSCPSGGCTATLPQQTVNPAAPSGVASASGGTIAAGTYYAKVWAVNATGSYSAAGPESAAVTTTGTTSSIAWTWTAVTNASSYYIVVGNASGAENQAFSTASNSYTQTTATGTTANPPTYSATQYPFYHVLIFNNGNSAGTPSQLTISANGQLIDGSATYGPIPYQQGVEVFSANGGPNYIALPFTRGQLSQQINSGNSLYPWATSQYWTLTGNVTVNNPAAGTDGFCSQIYYIENGTGGYTVTAPANVVGWPSISTAANAVNTFTMCYSSAAAKWIVTTPLSVNGVPQKTAYTVSTLPACSSATAGGAGYAVTDATTPTFLGTLTGGGSTYTPVVCNGTAWVAY